MVDLHKGFEGFERLSPVKKEDKENGLLLSKWGREPGTPSLKSDLAKSQTFYSEMIAYARILFDKVRDGKMAEIRADELMKHVHVFCEYMKNDIDPDDLVRLVFKEDDPSENYIYAHSVNVTFLAVRIAFEMNFTPTLLQDLVTSCLLHDVGMMKVPVNMWNNSSKLTESQYEEVRKHALYGEEVLGKIPGLSSVIPIVVGQHQERIDGSGYPRGLSKDAIHYLARLISLIDSYEAQTHARRWRRMALPDKSIQKILDEESMGFDPHFMKALLRYVSIYPVGTWVSISTGEVGEVVMTNKDTPMRPTVNVTYDRQGKSLMRPRVVDLSKQLLIHVDCCVESGEISKK
jgi:HD-GYP domain-containing protein (c-di-GMP phosphodiesterase class II)